MKDASRIETVEFEKKYLIDASVLVAGFLEGNQEAFTVFSNESQLYTIDLAMIESINVFKNKKLPLENVRSFQDALEEAPFIRLPLQKIDTEVAFRIAQDYGTSVYDALNHAVALKLSLTFLTLDAAYYKKAKSVGWIELLAS